MIQDIEEQLKCKEEVELTLTTSFSPIKEFEALKELQKEFFLFFHKLKNNEKKYTIEVLFNTHLKKYEELSIQYLDQQTKQLQLTGDLVSQVRKNLKLKKKIKKLKENQKTPVNSPSLYIAEYPKKNNVLYEKLMQMSSVLDKKHIDL